MLPCGEGRRAQKPPEIGPRFYDVDPSRFPSEASGILHWPFFPKGLVGTVREVRKILSSVVCTWFGQTWWCDERLSGMSLAGLNKIFLLIIPAPLRGLVGGGVGEVKRLSGDFLFLSAAVPFLCHFRGLQNE